MRVRVTCFRARGWGVNQVVWPGLIVLDGINKESFSCTKIIIWNSLKSNNQCIVLADNLKSISKKQSLFLIITSITTWCLATYSYKNGI